MLKRAFSIESSLQRGDCIFRAVHRSKLTRQTDLKRVHGHTCAACFDPLFKYVGCPFVVPGLAVQT